MSENVNTNLVKEDDEISTTDLTETTTTATNASASILCEKTIYELYKELYDYFGDSLCIKLPPVKTDHVFKPIKKETVVTLTDVNSGKTGEELLDEFMEQVRIQEEIDRVRREEERVKQEKLECERKERERIEQIQLAKEQKRLEEDRRKREEAKKRHEAARKQQERIDFDRKRNEDHRRAEDELRRAQEERFRADEERRIVDEERRLLEERQRIMEDKERKRIVEEKKLRRRQPMDKKRLKEEELRRQAEERQHHLRLAEERERQRQVQMREDQEKHGKQKRWLEMSRQEDTARFQLEQELIDVEAHSDGSDEAQDDIDVEEIKSDNSDEKSEEDTPPPILTVKNRISDPKGGVRLTIMKRPRLTMHLGQPSSAEAKPERSSKESKHGKRRKQTRDPESFEYVPFEDISTKQLYSPDTESSSDGQHPKITLKLKVKDPKDDLSSPSRDAFK